MTDDAGGHPSFEPGQVITIFRSRRRPEQLAASVEVMVEIEAAARAMDGFVDVKGFGADDGERVAPATTESALPRLVAIVVVGPRCRRDRILFSGPARKG